MTTTAVISLRHGREENEWTYVLSHLVPDEICIWGDFSCSSNMLINKTHITTFAELPQGTLILMSPTTSPNFPGNESLLSFTHPTDAIYVFGPNNENLDETNTGGRDPDHLVYIPTDTTDEMYNYVAYTVTMWHRTYG